jgi:hypothetical protein
MVASLPAGGSLRPTVIDLERALASLDRRFGGSAWSRIRQNEEAPSVKEAAKPIWQAFFCDGIRR